MKNNIILIVYFITSIYCIKIKSYNLKEIKQIYYDIKFSKTTYFNNFIILIKNNYKNSFINNINIIFEGKNNLIYTFSHIILKNNLININIKNNIFDNIELRINKIKIILSYNLFINHLNVNNKDNNKILIDNLISKYCMLEYFKIYDTDIILNYENNQYNGINNIRFFINFNFFIKYAIIKIINISNNKIIKHKKIKNNNINIIDICSLEKQFIIEIDIDNKIITKQINIIKDNLVLINNYNFNFKTVFIERKSFSRIIFINFKHVFNKRIYIELDSNINNNSYVIYPQIIILQKYLKRTSFKIKLLKGATDFELYINHIYYYKKSKKYYINKNEYNYEKISIIIKDYSDFITKYRLKYNIYKYKRIYFLKGIYKKSVILNYNISDNNKSLKIINFNKLYKYNTYNYYNMIYSSIMIEKSIKILSNTYFNLCIIKIDLLYIYLISSYKIYDILKDKCFNIKYINASRFKVDYYKRYNISIKRIESHKNKYNKLTYNTNIKLNYENSFFFLFLFNNNSNNYKLFNRLITNSTNNNKNTKFNKIKILQNNNRLRIKIKLNNKDIELLSSNRVKFVILLFKYDIFKYQVIFKRNNVNILNSNLITLNIELKYKINKIIIGKYIKLTKFFIINKHNINTFLL